MKNKSLKKSSLIHLNDKGVSILFSLLLLLVVSMVSVTIVAASLSSVKRTNSIKETNQDILTLESAALLLKNNINGIEITFPQQVTTSSRSPYVSKIVGSGVFNNDLISITTAFKDNTAIFCDGNDFSIKENNTDTVYVNTSCTFKNSTSDVDNKITFELSFDSNSGNATSTSTIGEKIYVTFDVNDISIGTSTVYQVSNFKASNKKS